MLAWPGNCLNTLMLDICHNKQYLPSHKINIFPTKTVKTKTKFAVPPSFGATRSRPDTA